MKPNTVNRLSTITLWVSMLLSVAVFAWFYYALLIDKGSLDNPQTNLLLYWLYGIALVATAVTAAFAVARLVRRGRSNPQRIVRPLLLTLLLALLLIGGYLISSPEAIAGLDASAFWLRITDMWIYAIFLLLGITFLAAIAGIVWSYLKHAN